MKKNKKKFNDKIFDIHRRIIYHTAICYVAPSRYSNTNEIFNKSTIQYDGSIVASAVLLIKLSNLLRHSRLYQNRVQHCSYGTSKLWRQQIHPEPVPWPWDRHTPPSSHDRYQPRAEVSGRVKPTLCQRTIQCQQHCDRQAHIRRDSSLRHEHLLTISQREDDKHQQTSCPHFNKERKCWRHRRFWQQPAGCREVQSERRRCHQTFRRPSRNVPCVLDVRISRVEDHQIKRSAEYSAEVLCTPVRQEIACGEVHWPENCQGKGYCRVEMCARDRCCDHHGKSHS